MEPRYITRKRVKYSEKVEEKEYKEGVNASTECICYRPHSNIICNGCGFWTRGRVRNSCPQHPKIVFLYDYAQCPRCRGYQFLLKEI